MSAPIDRRRRALVAALIATCIAAGSGVVIAYKTRPMPVVPAIPTALSTVPSAPEVKRPKPEPVAAKPAAPDAGRPEPAGPFGCSIPRASGTTRQAIDGGEYVLRVPASYEPERPYPILIVLWSEPLRSLTGFLKNSGLNRLADEEGVILIAPEYGERDVDPSVELTIESVRHAAERLCIDPARRYVIGHGGGGRRATQLRCKMGLSAMVASSSGQGVDEDICQSEPVPFLRIYGTLDARLPIEGGKGCFSGPYLPAARVEAGWAGRNDCEGRSKVYLRHGKSSCRIWKCAAPFALCELHGGHDWPGAPAGIMLPGCDDKPADFPATETVWRFFTEHGRSLTADPIPVR